MMKCQKRLLFLTCACVLAIFILGSMIAEVWSRLKLSPSEITQDLSDEEGLVAAAQKIQSKTGLVLYTLVNDAYLEFVMSWLCNTRWMPGVHDHVLLATTDRTSAILLRRSWPGVYAVPLNMPLYLGDQQYSRVGYVRIMVERTVLVLKLLESGVRLLLFEVDCVWIRDPLPYLQERAASDVDIVDTLVNDNSNRTAGGFLLLLPTNRTVILWRELTSLMRNVMTSIQNKTNSQGISWTQSDQEFLSALVKQNYGGIRMEHLPLELFPDGKWYGLPAAKRNSLPRPYIINNNFIIGNKNKKNRAIKWNHWFVTSDWRQRTGEAMCDNRTVFNVTTSR